MTLLEFSQLFNNFAVGGAAIVAIVAGYKILDDLHDRMKRNKLEKELKSLYPPREVNKTFELISSSANSDWIFLLDKNTGKKHHIASDATFRDLGYDRSQVKQLGRDVFSKIPQGKEFLTKGERYT